MVRMKRIALAGLLTVLGTGLVFGQAAPVTGVDDPAPLFTDKDPVINRNKQAAMHIVIDLLEAGHWNEADKWLTERYIQHNPLFGSGREPIVKAFGGTEARAARYRHRPKTGRRRSWRCWPIKTWLPSPRAPSSPIPGIRARPIQRLTLICGVLWTAKPMSIGTKAGSMLLPHRPPPPNNNALAVNKFEPDALIQIGIASGY
jgi:hypothetical protein